ncbi:MAG: pyruvate kinase [Kiritimatiellae bacterium]|nr:pyruvate kinase [Kiritimatiellia bacterium]MDD4341020.1 pyruvate kinase [Kiritimatiellia bacterium]
MRNTKIVCTIGPASDSRDKLGQLMDAGMNVVRLNFSHGTQEEHGQKIALIREIAAEKHLAIAILQDLAGPKIRMGIFANGPVELKPGDTFTLTARDVPGDEREVSVTYRDLPRDVHVGDTLLLADGELELRVEAVVDDDIRCHVILGGQLSSHKGINLPSRSIRAPILTAKDHADLAFGIAQGVDYVALSFVRSAADIEIAREAMRALGQTRPIIAKIEKHEALAELDGIVAAVDGVMVARGDLGVDIPPEKVPTAQRLIIEKANFAGKPVITATQMLKSMTDAPRPARAEVTDVTNAVLEGSDAVMLSEETAVGLYPVEAVRTMARIATEAEKAYDQEGWGQRLHLVRTRNESEALARAACGLAETIDAKALLIATQSGTTARLAAQVRPGRPILAGTMDAEVFRRLALVRGVRPMLIPQVDLLTRLFEELHRGAKETGLAQPGDTVVCTAGFPPGKAGVSNLIKIERVP